MQPADFTPEERVLLSQRRDFDEVAAALFVATRAVCALDEPGSARLVEA